MECKPIALKGGVPVPFQCHIAPTKWEAHIFKPPAVEDQKVFFLPSCVSTPHLERSHSEPKAPCFPKKRVEKWPPLFMVTFDALWPSDNADENLLTGLSPPLFSLPLRIITELPTCTLHALDTHTHTNRLAIIYNRGCKYEMDQSGRWCENIPIMSNTPLKKASFRLRGTAAGLTVQPWSWEGSYCFQKKMKMTLIIPW